MDGLRFWHQFGNGCAHTESAETSAVLAKYDSYLWSCDIRTADALARTTCTVQLGMRSNMGVVIGAIVLFGYLDAPGITVDYVGMRNKSSQVFSTNRDSLDDILQGWFVHVDGVKHIRSGSSPANV